MSVDDDVVKGGKAGDGAFRQPPSSAGTTTVVFAAAVEQIKPPSKVHRHGGEDTDRDETVRLLGEPLTSHGPYTFYGALAYRDSDDAARQKEQQRRRKSSTCGDDCSAEWTVVRMNHFYAVRPWYSKRNTCAADRKLEEQQRRGRRKKSPTSRAAAKERSEHHHQQSVCIAELELLWRDETVAMSTAKNASNGDVTTTTTASGSNSSNSLQGGRGGAGSSDDETAGSGTVKTTVAAAAAAAATNIPTPHRRMLPRRKRQPSAKKLEAAESYAAAAADRGHPLYRRNRTSSAATMARNQFPSPAHYAHGNLLCSVRLYVMPDQTGAGRLSGVHGEDEVLEINTWGANGGGADANAFVNGCGEYGGNLAGTPQSKCSGLVLRAEDFVEWVRGGLMHQDGDDDDDTEDGSPDDDSGAENASAKSSAVPPAEVGVDDGTDKQITVKTESALSAGEGALAASKTDAKMLTEQSLHHDGVAVKKEREEVVVAPAKDGRSRSVVVSAVGEAVDAESVPLAAADIFKKRVALKNKALMNGGEPMAEDQKSATVDIKCDVKQCGKKKTKTCSNKQRLVIMSYSRYCRYRAHLQRSLEERLNRGDTSSDSTMDTIRVLFCRDTYDYPAELLLQPFNPPHGYQQNSSVLANYMAPKLRGWPSYPASWMSFRWNRVRRLLRHMERGNGSNEEQRRLRRRRKKLKKSRRRYVGGSGGTTVALGYSSSTDDGDSDDSDSDDDDDGSSATNDGVCTNATTSDSDGAPPAAAIAKAAAAATAKNHSASNENGGGRHRAIVSASSAGAGGVFFVNGATPVSAVQLTANKRPATTVSGQLSALQQSSKRRCIVYAASPTTAGQRPQIRAVYPQPQHPRPRLPPQLYRHLYQFNQQSRLQLNRRLPAPVSSLQPRTAATRLAHLPPSVSILPVVTPGTKNVAIFQQLQQQQQFFNRLPPGRPKKQPSVSQLQNISIGRQQQQQQQQQQHTTLSPVLIEYANSGQKNNKNHVLTTVMGACHRRVRCIDLEEEEQQEDDEKQRQWLVDALRLGGLEVTAVPLNKIPGHEETGKVTVQQQQTRSKRETARPGDVENPDGAVPVEPETHSNDCGNNDSNQDSDTDSIVMTEVMTVTPDVISMLNKTSGQQQTSSTNSSAPSTPAQKQQRPTESVVVGCGQRGVAAGVVTAPALHDKINRAIDSLKQQQQKQTSNNCGANVLAIDVSSPRPYNNATEELRQRKMIATGTNLTCQQLQTFKPGKLIPHKQLPAVKIKINTEQKQQAQKRELAGLPTPGTNVGISLVPTTLAVAYVTKVQTQHLQKACASTVVRNVPVSNSEASTSMSVKQQLQRRITAGSSKPPALTPIAGTWSSISDRQLHHNYHQQRNNNSTFVTTTEPSLLPRQQQIIILASPTGNASLVKQPLNDKICPQQKKKD